jgi:hypothetical protein
MATIQAAQACDSCAGTGEMGTEFGPADCADCGGSGQLPPHNSLVEWRARDIERAVGSGVRVAPADVKWLLAELRSARAALTETLALAHDLPETEGIGPLIRSTANRALGLYTVPKS